MPGSLPASNHSKDVSFMNHLDDADSSSKISIDDKFDFLPNFIDFESFLGGDCEIGLILIEAGVATLHKKLFPSFEREKTLSRKKYYGDPAKKRKTRFNTTVSFFPLFHPSTSRQTNFSVSALFKYEKRGWGRRRNF